MRFIYLFSLLVMSTASFSQHGDIEGLVKTQDGQPAAFVNIVIKETGKGTTSSESGFYSIKRVKAGEYTLISSFIGLHSQEQRITVKPGEVVTLNFSLAENARQLEEIVISDSHGLNEFLPAIG